LDPEGSELNFIILLISHIAINIKKMCSVFKNKNLVLKPGRVLKGANSHGEVSGIWAGFARSEILDWWRRQGAEEVELTATSFAERSGGTGKLVWEDVPEGYVISAILDQRESPALLKVVTRPANAEELSRFEHPRLPLLRKRRFAAVSPGEEEPDLFSALGPSGGAQRGDGLVECGGV
jgi:hypothetical protein